MGRPTATENPNQRAYREKAAFRAAEPAEAAIDEDALLEAAMAEKRAVAAGVPLSDINRGRLGGGNKERQQVARPRVTKIVFEKNMPAPTHFSRESRRRPGSLSRGRRETTTRVRRRPRASTCF